MGALRVPRVFWLSGPERTGSDVTIDGVSTVLTLPVRFELCLIRKAECPR